MLFTIYYQPDSITSIYDMSTAQLSWAKEHRQDAQWLHQVLEQGFVLHAMDGDRSNTEAFNLVLIYGKDADKLVGWKPAGGSEPLSGDIRQFIEERLNKSKACYELRRSGEKWSDIAQKLSVVPCNAVAMANRYAKAQGLPSLTKRKNQS